MFSDGPRRYFFSGSFVCFVFCVSHAFASVIAALWSPAGKGLTSWLFLVMFIVCLLLSYMVSCIRCVT